jgi:hypothetical protein
MRISETRSLNIIDYGELLFSAEQATILFKPW